MATRTGTVTGVVSLRGPDSMLGGETNVASYAVFIDNQSGSSVIVGTDTLRISSLVTQISTFVRDGKTRTVVGGVAPFQHGVSSEGTACGFTTSLSGAQLDISPNATVAAGNMLQPFAVVVTVQEV